MSTLSPSGDGKSRVLLIAAALGFATALVAVGTVYAWKSSGSQKKRKRILAVIPARYASTRFPGKPLASIAGKPMIQHVWEQARKAREVDHLVVATDDDRVADCCRGFGADVVMTSDCRNGSERCAQVLQLLPGFDIVVNVQGDEPLVDPSAIDAVALGLQSDEISVSCIGVADLSADMAASINRVKCAADAYGHALYLSRALIPMNKTGEYRPGGPYLLALGLQAYTSAFLQHYARQKPGDLEDEEQVEQLRVLEMGYRMKVIKVPHRGHGVDIPEDVKKIEDLLTKV